MSDPAVDPAPVTRAGFRRGLAAGLPLALGNGLGGVVMGVAYHGLGLGLPTAVLFSLVVYSGTAQAVVLGLWAMPPPILAMMAACVGTNARYLVMSAHLRTIFPRAPRRLMMPVLAILADASWIMTVAEAGKGRADIGYLIGCSLPMALAWTGGTALGHALPFDPQGPLAVAAAFLPLAFVVVLLPSQWRGRRDLLPWLLSAGIAAVAVGPLGPGWAMLLGGGVGTLLSAWLERDA